MENPHCVLSTFLKCIPVKNRLTQAVRLAFNAIKAAILANQLKSGTLYKGQAIANELLNS